MVTRTELTAIVQKLQVEVAELKKQVCAIKIPESEALEQRLAKIEEKLAKPTKPKKTKQR